MFFWKKNQPTRGKKSNLSATEKEELVRKLRETAADALKKGKHDLALSTFRELIQLQPQNPEWRRKLADLYRVLKEPARELEARCRAATLYAEDGFILKGIAMCKMALALDPEHRETQRQLAELNALTGGAPAAQGSAREGLDENKSVDPALREQAKEAALKAARERVEAVRRARERAAAAEAIATTVAHNDPASGTPGNALEAEETPGSSEQTLAPDAPLEALALKSVIPSQPTPSSPGSISQPGSYSRLGTPDDDEDIFIAPLDVDESTEEKNSDSGRSEPREAVARALRRTPLLSDLNEASFLQLLENVRLKTLEEGEVLFEQGARADAMYAVVEGEVTATVGGDVTLELARLGEGEFFGEIGLLAEQPRQATITATRTTQLLQFERQLVHAMGETEPQFIRILLRFVRERLVASLIATNPLFALFAGDDAEDLTRRFHFLEVRARKALVREGVPSEGVFILLTGQAKVSTSTEGAPRELGILGPGGIFGEMSVINRENAVASVVTSTKCYILKLPAQDFTQLVMMHPAVLAHVSSLVSQREEENRRLLSGEGGVDEDRLSLV